MTNEEKFLAHLFTVEYKDEKTKDHMIMSYCAAQYLSTVDVDELFTEVVAQRHKIALHL